MRTVETAGQPIIKDHCRDATGVDPTSIDHNNGTNTAGHDMCEGGHLLHLLGGMSRASRIICQGRYLASCTIGLDRQLALCIQSFNNKKFDFSCIRTCWVAHLRCWVANQI